MANAINFLARAPSLGSCTFKTTRAIPSIQPSAHLKLGAIRKDGARHSVFINPKIKKLRPYHIVAVLDASDDSTFEDAASDVPVGDKHEPDHGHSVTKMIREFYECVNGKYVNRLGELFSDECWFDDYSFPKPWEKMLSSE